MLGNTLFQGPILTSCLFACILLAHWLFISTYKAHINALFCMTIFYLDPLTQPNT